MLILIHKCISPLKLNHKSFKYGPGAPAGGVGGEQQLHLCAAATAAHNSSSSRSALQHLCAAALLPHTLHECNDAAAQALKAMYPEDEGCFVLAPAEEQAWAAATAAVAAADGGTAAQQQHPNLSGTIRCARPQHKAYLKHTCWLQCLTACLVLP